MACGKESVLAIGKMSALVARVVPLGLRLRLFGNLSAKIKSGGVESELLLSAHLFTSLRAGSHTVTGVFI